jgi:hypothetical protein
MFGAVVATAGRLKHLSSFHFLTNMPAIPNDMTCNFFFQIENKN